MATFVLVLVSWLGAIGLDLKLLSSVLSISCGQQ